jgi:hypothetical protein
VVDSRRTHTANVTLPAGARGEHLLRTRGATAPGDALEQCSCAGCLHPRHPRGQTLGARKPAIARVSAEQLVGPLAANRNRHVGTRESGKRPESYERLVCERLPESTDGARNLVDDVLLTEHELVVLGADRLSRAARRVRLVDRADVVADGKCLQPPGGVGGCDGGNECRVDATAQEHAKRDVREEPAADRDLE